MPDWGFLFPQFNDRSTDIHGLLYYTKNAENLRSTMMEEVFGCTTPLSAGTQRDSFNALVEETPVSYTHLDVYKRQVWNGI